MNSKYASETSIKDMPIGFYDSGVGGISVLRETVKLLPHEDFIYYGDNANAPYGAKTEAEIKELSIRCGDFLHGKGVKAIVIACNTATSIVVQTMREKYNIPIISMEPAVKPAAQKYADGKIAVMATPATLGQQRYLALLDRLGIQSRIINVECGQLAALVEEGRLDSPKIKACVYEKLIPLANEENICAIVMGCTHYSFISTQIHDVARKILKGNCEIFDGMYGTARQTANVLAEAGLLSGRQSAGEVAFFSSKGDSYMAILKRFYSL